MPRLGPISRVDFIASLRRLGFSGPYRGGKHEFMVKGTRRLILPSSHSADIDTGLLARLLNQAGISREQWEARCVFSREARTPLPTWEGGLQD